MRQIVHQTEKVDHQKQTKSFQINTEMSIHTRDVPEYQGKFLDFLEEQNLGYNKIFREVNDIHKTKCYYKSFQEEWGVFDIHEYFYNRELLRQRLTQLDNNNYTQEEFYSDYIINQAKIGLVFKVNGRVAGHIGIIHGGFVLSLIDQAQGGMLGRLFEPTCMFATIDLKSKFFIPMKCGQEYLIINSVHKNTEKIIIFKTEIFNTKKQVCCTAYGTFKRLFKIDRSQMQGQSLNQDQKQKKTGFQMGEESKEFFIYDMIQSIGNIKELMEEEQELNQRNLKKQQLQFQQFQQQQQQKQQLQQQQQIIQPKL